MSVWLHKCRQRFVRRKLSVALGMSDLGAVRNYIQPLRPARILQRMDFQLATLNGLPSTISLAARTVKVATRQSIWSAASLLCSDAERSERTPRLKAPRRMERTITR